MRPAKLRLVIPLTVISFLIGTKYWHAAAVDSPDRVLFGFPFPFATYAIHTSMAFDVFIAEFCADLLIYFVCWLALMVAVDRYVMKVNAYGVPAKGLLVAAGVVTVYAIVAYASPDNTFYVHRDFDITLIKTGFCLLWGPQPW